MTYQEAVQFLFEATPVFQHVGATAYKPGLERMQSLDEYYKYPHKQYQTIHVGGTNGKGSTSHTLAAILQSAGYRVGLFTSPHLVDFRERIRVNGVCVDEEYVCRFVEGAQTLVDQYQPSFFELTCMMAFSYFADQAVDIAIIEVGLGGRLDCTNVIEPICSVITNISLEHTQYLGDTLAKIAGEKAGIIKPNIPVVIGQADAHEVREVFCRHAESLGSPLILASESNIVQAYSQDEAGYYHYETKYGTIKGELRGIAQVENTATILSTIVELEKVLNIPQEAIQRGFADVTRLTGLMGRWQLLQQSPTVICDTGHNVAGIKLILQQIKLLAPKYRRVHLILGFANDKDVSSILKLLPLEYHYYMTQASVSRAISAKELYETARSLNLNVDMFPSVESSVDAVLSKVDAEDFVFIGGSNFVVADLLSYWIDRVGYHK